MRVPLLDLQAQYQTIRDEVRVAVDRVFESQQFVMGAEVQALEEEIAEYPQAKFAIGCASGSEVEPRTDSRLLREIVVPVDLPVVCNLRPVCPGV